MSCPDCYRGSVHEGQPRGEVTKAYGLDTYVVNPADGRPAKGIVVILPDAFGWEFVNIRLLADSYADKGDFKVYAPDFMKGHPAPLYLLESMRVMGSDAGIFTKIRHIFGILTGVVPFLWINWPSKAWPRVKGFFEQLRKEEGASQSVGAAGFCWGGKQVVLLGRGDQIDGRPLIDAGFTGHPSLLSLPADINSLTLPVSFALADQDTHLPVEKAEGIKTIVEAKPESARGEVVVYPNCSHGFCVRVDQKFTEIAKQADDATDQAIAWFNAHFKSSA
ncbi:uncharacterized protein TrAtP1_001364 [Trichoderma atroviride]|uniref:Dienelactone hydrolase domain-containing protein n=1 Tax=Hypocrea atroviridis (strain ATCC 20476 / IMI 206040) TaxID=452589 RepID=G9P1W6_HYPAI|nr:uncharacterized protein TRIATDRAFT_301229 [Trichoderma atroviride IMI 206040]EHK43393.1 hypothetical protein TRIATDRAFT_301229 [Trichoderma atroviride IMI 206040]UKZ60078.1 hypothetical protein TrAtP1_001364 [Trichoderma atroviride]